MNDKVFFDSNILIYSVHPIDTRKNKIAQELTSQYLYDSLASVQVLNEMFYVLTKKNLKTPLEAEEIIHSFAQDLHILPLTVLNTLKAIQLQQQLKYSFWDCLMISSALMSGCSIFFSEDLHSNQLIENQLKIINPFAS